MMDYWRDAKFDELGSAARFSVDEKFRREAYRDITKIFLEIRKFNFKFRRA